MEAHLPPEIHGTVKVGPQGQVVIPASLRKEMHIKTGDIMVVFSKDNRGIGIVPQAEVAKLLSSFEAISKKGSKTITQLKKLAKTKR